ncbi:MAG: DUF1217 domain-containing protein [Rhodobacteraceae bacterium]|nr:DUF1217 domain-containing protein [Paracoccaceae bacterium]
MSFQPVLPTGGYAGWSFLTNTRATQQEAFNASTQMTRDVAYFEENIASISSAEDLVADRRLLQVALGAFGLDEDINNKYFLQKVLEDGTLDADALGNRLSDKRYFEFAKAFGFGDFDTPRTVLSDFPAEITAAFQDRQFEIAVGDQNQDMRLAMGLDRALEDITGKDTTEDGRWFLVMGQPAVRQVFETALGLPASIGVLDLDQQLSAFRDKAAARFGSGEVAQFADADAREDLVRLFLLRSELQVGSGVSAGQSAALTLLQNSQGVDGLFGLLG